MAVWIDLLDQFRYITGILVILFMVCHNALPRREGFARRVALSCVCALAVALAFVPLKRALQNQIARLPVVTGPYWLAMSAVPVLIVAFCYETNPAGALFRTMMAAITENVVTSLVRYLFVLCFFPSFPQNHPVWYVAILLTTYAVVYAAAWPLMCRRIQRDESDMYPDARATARNYLFVYIAYSAILSVTKMVGEFLILPLGSAAEFSSIYRYLQYFLVGDMLLISVVMGVVLVNSYNIVTLQNEQQVIRQMIRDRQAQYEFSRENIEMINQKAHDLKHQLRALEQVSDDERRQQLRETRKAIDFYDAVVKTGNAALDTLLTEKSVFCHNHGIRLSCTVNTRLLDHVAVVDLYTLLGNAIDNAIESVDALENPDRKVVSLTIRDQGQMVFMHIENYYEGSILMNRGLPITRKKDKLSHGYGVKSIQNIARRYGGSTMIQTENQIFSLEILLPVQS